MDEIVQPVAPVQNSAPVALGETVVAPVTTPASTEQAPPVATAPETNPEAPVAPVEAPQPATTVLGEALEVKESAPVEAPKEPTEEAPKNEGGQSENTAPPPKYDPFTLPEGVTLDDTRIGEFTGLLSELELDGKATHEAVQKFGQKALEFHINEVKNTIEGLTKIYQESWDNQKAAWKEAFLNDPEIGGNRFQTTIDSALTFIRTHGGTPEQQQEFRALMDTSGLGNHPAMIRMLAKAGQAMKEGAPLAAPKPVSQPKSRTQVMYGKG